MQDHWQVVWRQFRKNKIGFAALIFFLAVLLIGIYAPLLASSKPLVVLWNKRLYFPLFRYLFYRGFYSKPIDLFYNTLMFTLPFFLLFRKRIVWIALSILQIALFLFFLSGGIKDPSSTEFLREARREEVSTRETFHEDPALSPLIPYQTWDNELKYMTPQAKLNVLLRNRQREKQHEKLAPYRERYFADIGQDMNTLWHVDRMRENEKRAHLQKTISATKEDYENALEQLPQLIAAYRPYSHNYLMAKYELVQARQNLDAHLDHLHSEEYLKAHALLAFMEKKLSEVIQEGAVTRIPLDRAKSVIQTYRDAMAENHYLNERAEWIKREDANLYILVPPILRSFHWEDDAGGAQLMNKYVPWTERTRINRKDMLASLIFGIRVSLVVGISAVVIALLIGIPLGTFSGYFAGKVDLIICRLVEIWEAMPTFFMLLLIVAISQSKSIFVVIIVLGIFGWTSFCRFIRAEVLRQRSLPYVLATKSMGYGHSKIMFSHILPNAIPPILTLLPFSLMAAITSEAGLSFLGLGEEGSSSWGVLMDEGRSVFPGESYLLWPPAILLTLLLISIALIGDVLRDALDPKLRS